MIYYIHIDVCGTGMFEYVMPGVKNYCLILVIYTKRLSLLRFDLVLIIK